MSLKCAANLQNTIDIMRQCDIIKISMNVDYVKAVNSYQFTLYRPEVDNGCPRLNNIKST